MNDRLNTALCTQALWEGRAHCESCHIRHLMLFSELPESAFESLLQPIDQYLYTADSVIFEAETHNNFIYSIRQGMVKLVNTSRDGTNRIVRLLGPGFVIGLELLDGAESYHHTAIAQNQVDLCRIPIVTVKQLYNLYPDLYRRVNDQLQQQLNLADQWIVTLGTGTAKQRVAHLLLILNEFFADKNGDFTLLNREDMAAMIGIALETVSRVIAEFKRQNIIYRTKDKLYCCDIPALKKLTSQHQ